MEKYDEDLENFRQNILKNKEEERNNLRSLAELLNLKVIREARNFNNEVIFVEGSGGKEVMIGFPDGKSGKPCATGRIDGVEMKTYGHGPWSYFIDI